MKSGIPCALSTLSGVFAAALTILMIASAAAAEAANPCNCSSGGVSFLAGEQTDKLLNDRMDAASSMPLPFLTHPGSSLQGSFTALNATEAVVTNPDRAEQILILDGTGTLKVGGTVLDDKPVSPTQRRGSSINGGVSYALTPNSLVDIPAGMPRWIIVPTGGHLSYLSLKEAK
jgi:hypothetical protein